VAVASFHLVPKSALPGLVDAATPKKTWLGKPQDPFPEYLAELGSTVATYDWSAYVLMTLLVYLQSRGVDLLKSAEHEDLVMQLADARGFSCNVLTHTHRDAYLARLVPEAFSEDELRDYFNELNGASETYVGRPMLEGIRVLARSLAAVDPQSVILLIMD
jgi:hypothetical protein